jgi:hypothetical protein
MHVVLPRIGWPGASNAQGLKNLWLHYERKFYPLVDIAANGCLLTEDLDELQPPDSRVKIRAAGILNLPPARISNPPEQCSRRNPSWAMYRTRCPRGTSS